jgi:hypothetical protein
MLSKTFYKIDLQGNENIDLWQLAFGDLQSDAAGSRERRHYKSPFTRDAVGESGEVLPPHREITAINFQETIYELHRR